MVQILVRYRIYGVVVKNKFKEVYFSVPAKTVPVWIDESSHAHAS